MNSNQVGVGSRITGTGAAVEAEPKEVERQFRRLEDTSKELNGVVGALRARLNCVLSNTDGPENKLGVPHPVMVPLAERLAILTDSIDASMGEIISITNRVELPY
jgi:hypothetical protein